MPGQTTFRPIGTLLRVQRTATEAEPKDAPSIPAMRSAGRRGRAMGLGVVLLGGALAACQPTVRMEAPREPITINLNIKLDADVRVRLEEQAREDIQQNPSIF